jgi:serine phosphatase RsbU (regulator of sigma subunit)
LRIQNAVLPNEHTMRGTVPGDFFVMYKPKDIVSGDFFFVDRRGDWTLVAVADCTGHGVPGAFVSMLCISLLNEIVKQQETLQANMILNELREKVISSLQQKGIQGEQMDGMDISLLLINGKTKKCQWSGANNPLYIVSSKTKQLEELKPDKRPIAIYPDMDAFTNHEVSVSKGDTLYLFTDGYSDQFGGEKGKKFMSRNFKNLLVEHAHKPMAEQQRILDHTIEAWKEGHEQIDDITVVGIRVN